MKFTPRLPPEGINTSNEHPLKEFVFLLVGFGLVVALVVAILSVSVDYLVDFIPPSAEANLFAKTSLIATDNSDSPDLRRTKVYLTQLVQALNRAADSPQTVSVDIVLSKEPNAFVIPGGRIFVTSGLLALLDTENGLAMVLAHEWAHQHFRHPIKGLGKGIVIATVLAVISGSQDNAWLSDLLSGAVQVGLLAYSRDQERRADALGLMLTSRVYGHSVGADEFFNKILSKERVLDVPTFLNSHPAIEERVARINSSGNDLGHGTTPLPEYVKHYAEALGKKGQPSSNGLGTTDDNRGAAAHNSQ